MRSPTQKIEDSSRDSGKGDVVTPSPHSDSAYWLRIEVATDALRHNMALFRARVKKPTKLMAVVKANGYGHGLQIAAQSFLAGGADVLGVHSLCEARELRKGGVKAPLIILGPVTEFEVVEAANLDAEITVASLAAAEAAARAAHHGTGCRIHLKVESGVNRQGVTEKELDSVLTVLTETKDLQIVGLSSHYADIEDTTDHTFARQQKNRFDSYVQLLASRGLKNVCRHMSCSAAAILWESSHFDMVRVGISGYGIWPSRESLISAREAGHGDLPLRPALTWKCRVAQVKEVSAGETVGYGRVWKAPVDSRIAVLPVGYSDGYPRALSGRAHVLIHGCRAPITGRICMNLIMVDVSHVTTAAGDEAVLLGRQGHEVITAEQLADMMNSIPYEVITLPGSTWERVPI